MSELRTDFDSWEEVVLYAKRKAKERIREEILREKEKTPSTKHSSGRLEDKIEKLLEDEALPVCAIRKALEENGEREINRRALWRKIKKLERWDRIKKVTARKVSYYKAVEE